MILKCSAGTKYASMIDDMVEIVDEATASLGVENETLIQESLSRLIENKTVMIIAHRMRTVAGAGDQSGNEAGLAGRKEGRSQNARQEKVRGKRRRKMENRKKKAWIYIRIDAPEDIHGTLKKQYEQLNTYGEQLRVEIAGSSSDMGEETGLERSGLNLFLEAKDSREIEVLLIPDSSRISRDKNLCREFLRRMTKSRIEVCSPMEGILTASPQQADATGGA